MNKLIIFFLFFTLFLIPFLSTSTLGISPGTIIFSITPGEIVCKNFTIFADNDSMFYGEIKWNKENSRNINQYILSSEELNINTNFPNKTKTGQHQICLSAKKERNYYGALTYKMENSSYGIGTWIELNITKNNSNQNILLLTGNTIKKINTKTTFLFTPILLFIVLIFLLFKLKKKNPSEFNKNI